MDLDTFNLQLLLTSLSLPSPPAEPSSHPAAGSSAAGLALLQQGDYLAALKLALTIILPSADPPESAADWFELLQATAAEIVSAADGLNSEAGRAVTLAAVAALYVYTQCNLTGPFISVPECPFDLMSMEPPFNGACSAVPPATGSALGRDSQSAADRWACAQLAENGEDLVGLVRYPQYLVLPKVVLQTPVHGTPAPAWAWWGMRAAVQQQRALAARSAALKERLTGLTSRVLAAFAPPLPLGEVDALRRDLAGAALLEAALMETVYGCVAEAKACTDRALSALGVHAQLSGVLGVRTAHQQDAHAQLVLKVTLDSPPAAPAGERLNICGGVDGATLDAALAEGCGATEDARGLQGDTDVLRRPQLSQEGLNAGGGSLPPLSPLQQAAVLALGVHAKKGSSVDGLQPWEVLAHADAVLQQPRSAFLVRAAARLQVTRSERQRPRTRERALLELEGLVNALDAPRAPIPACERLQFAFSVWFPPSVSIRKELGEAFVALGLVGAALPLFESLELWDNLIVCYRLLDKKVAAEELVRRRLEARPEDSRLWCALGDLTLDDAHYDQAWERSGRRSARAARSLARNAVRGDRFAAAAARWEEALALNPLHAEGWFHLGWCYIKVEDYQGALRALTRAAQMDSENGDTWNNLAAVHMRLERWPEAFAALTEAVKHKRDSWHTWDNYAGVAARQGEWQTAVRAVSHVVGLTQGQKLQLGLLSSIVNHVERVSLGAGAGSAPFQHSPDGAETEESSQNGANAAEDAEAAELAVALGDMALVPRAAAPPTPAFDSEKAAAGAAAAAAAPLVKAVGNLMKQIAGTVGGDSAFWGQYARFNAALGETDAAAECLLKRVRALQGSKWQADEASFEAYAEACLGLSLAYMKAGGARELAQARMLLRGLTKQAGERFEAHAAYVELQEILGQVEEKAAALKSGSG